MTLEFLLTSLVIIASPGTGAIYTVAAGLSGGTRASFIAAFGCTLGIVPHMLAAVSGLAALLHTSALAFQILKYLGVAYLLYMAWAMFRDRGLLSLNDEAAGKSVRQVIVSAIFINLLNPKLSIFFFAFLPQFVKADDASPVSRMLELSLVFMALTFVIFAAYGAFAAAVRRHVISSASVQTWMRRGFAAAFAALAAQLALASR
ncbi:LysE family translocator [Mesorhizobium humile]|uniref:LysE family translocator n=1 Tax=Mesorhizobium humile TaxID=3072313 RepID=A0ABU4YI44_9HYPH|nr:MULTISPECIES: LysE family translocator [unclassified Mesorhizobium]MDX8457587.1 LysE family translocator [Mesorhizobium sp. VK2D]MDX8485604.1 LysE family translocator [Mesorhizobium sp. VK2B]